MQIDIISIGNSKGIRIPAAMLKQLGRPDKVEVTFEKNGLQIGPARKPREGWEEQFKAVAAAGEDELLIPETVVNEFDTSGEWEWE